MVWLLVSDDGLMCSQEPENLRSDDITAACETRRPRELRLLAVLDGFDDRHRLSLDDPAFRRVAPGRFLAEVHCVVAMHA